MGNYIINTLIELYESGKFDTYEKCKYVLYSNDLFDGDVDDVVKKIISQKESFFKKRKRNNMIKSLLKKILKPFI